MLDKIENAYLAALRVMALLAATAALVVFVLAASQGLPGLFNQLGWSESGKNEPSPLAEFIREQKPHASGEEAQPSSTSTGAPVPQKVQDAAKILKEYAASKQVPIEPGAVVDVLMAKRGLIADDQKDAYDDSLLALMQELRVSKGKPLDVDHINALLNWHIEKFNERIAAKALEKEAAAVKTAAAIQVGTLALASFFMIIFFFIFVKIERNLRLVKTREA